MAIYRPPKARWPLAIAAAAGGLVLGLATGLMLGGGDPNPTEAARAIETELTSAAGSLEVAAVEYQESVAGSEVTKEAEFEGARAALSSSRSRYSKVRPALAALPVDVESIDELYDELESSMKSHADPATVSSSLEELESLLRGET